MNDSWLDSNKGRFFHSLVWAGIVLCLFQALKNGGFINWDNDVTRRLCIAIMIWMAIIGGAINPIYSSSIYINTIVISIFAMALVGAIELTFSFVVDGLVWPKYKYTTLVSVSFVPILMTFMSFRMIGINEGKRSIRRVLSRYYFVSIAISFAILLLGIARYWHALKDGFSVNIQF